MYFTAIQKAVCNIWPDVVTHLLLFVPHYIMFFFTKSFDFIKLCTHDFSRVNLATELSTNLVYNSIFVKDYDIYFFHVLFFL